MKKLILFYSLLIFSQVAWANESIYDEDFFQLAKKAVDNQKDTKVSSELAKKMSAFVNKKLNDEAASAKQPVKTYIESPRSMDVFMGTLQRSLDDSFLRTLSREDLLLMSMELGMRFQIQTQVRFPNLKKESEAQKLLTETLLPKVEAALKARPSSEKKEIKAATNGFCTPSNDLLTCETPDGKVYKLDSGVNQLSRRIKKESEHTGADTKSPKAVIGK